MNEKVLAASSSSNTSSHTSSYDSPAALKSSKKQKLPYDWKEKLHEPDFDIDRSNAGRSMTAYYNLVCCVCGTGMLSLSSVLASGGWGALALLILCWWMTMYASCILIRCLYYGGEKRLESVNKVAEAAFGRWGNYVSFFFNAWLLLGTPTLYIVLCGQNLNDLCQGTVAEIGQIPWSIVFAATITIFFVFMKTMDSLSWTSCVGVIATFATTLIIVIEAARDPEHPVDTVVRENIVWDGWPSAVAVIAFSLGGNVIYPNCEAAMRRPERWPMIAISGLSTCALTYIMISVPGYFVYGEAAENPIYNNIPHGVGRIMAIVLVTCNIMVSIPIFAGSFALDCENIMGITVERLGKRKEFIYRAIWRIFIMVFCTVIACTVPHFSPLMSLFGAFGYSTTIFIIPVLCYYKLTGLRNKPFYELIGGFLTILMGLVGLIFGTWDAIESLIVAFRGEA
ncbi:transmembrane amino acid transporter protein-domain-containing protein [Zychaea mexicana]|uniref:transmembrane amino acid transporter protein-domain-containing protein n=1 Tax=Zychaea mexicana TaxID=64656 RepID=UPI0022FEC9A9|nr:transmembrane amino acid transporter protein-domain-containing protein [Zychaea mexicana]KAI9496313.1 transmembrane amino acid transporter protein-domain-containing protein [Zychaea mexicana]